MTSPTTREAILSRWEARRREYERLGALVEGAKLCEQVLSDLRALLEVERDQLLDVRQAAELTGRSEETIRRWVRARKIANHGGPGSIRVCRGDLLGEASLARMLTKESWPKSKERGIPERQCGDYDPVEDARDIAQRMGMH